LMGRGAEQRPQSGLRFTGREDGMRRWLTERGGLIRERPKEGVLEEKTTRIASGLKPLWGFDYNGGHEYPEKK